MKRPKINLDTEKLKSFCLHHCEKMVLVVVVLLVAFFVYRGFQLGGLEQTRTPDKLSEAARSTVSFIEDEQRWKELAKTRQVNIDIAALVDKGQQPSDASLYRLPIPWNKQDFPKLVPRTDPTIYPPIHVKVVSMIGPLAVYNDGTLADPLAEAFPTETAPAKPVRPKKRPRRGPGEEAFDQMPGSEGGPGAPGGPRQRTVRGRRQPQSEEMMMPGDVMMPQPGGFGEGMGGPQGLNPESIFGFPADQSAQAKAARINVISAVVPFEKQQEEFDRALKNSLDYNEIRDSVRHLQYAIQRIDVTDDPDISDPAKWKSLGVKAALMETDLWAGFPEEVLDPNYLDYGDPASGKEPLTHPAPPFIQRDLWDLLTHPEVPLLSLASQGYGVDPLNPAGTGTTEKPGVESDLPTDLPRGIPGAGGEFMPGRGMPGSEMGYQRPQRGGMMGEGYGGVAGGRPQPNRPQPGMGSMDGFGGEPYGAQSQTQAIPKYKLIRFNDTTVVSGRQYRYKLSIYLEDPNHPSSVFAPPSVQALDPTVRERLKNVDPKTYWVRSEWSEPSAVVTLPPSESFHAGNVKPAYTVDIVPNKPPLIMKEPVATALTVVFDPAKAVDVPAEKEVYRGSTLNFTADVDVIHPTLKIVRKLEKYSFKTDAIVADILGGEEIPQLDKVLTEKALQAPGELLFFDAAGNLHVQDESADIESFRRYLVPKVEMMPATGEAGFDPLGVPGGEGLPDGGDPLGGARRRRSP